ncbi:GH25 family lysozyme, partial [Loigolactobacillus iwatensis]|uniref:GH25 family lysozyme n=1 Tax=Loigolactobacillus iwatensis TaxID=1267156 RepID=UPI000F7E24EB
SAASTSAASTSAASTSAASTAAASTTAIDGSTVDAEVGSSAANNSELLSSSSSNSDDKIASNVAALSTSSQVSFDYGHADDTMDFVAGAHAVGSAAAPAAGQITSYVNSEGQNQIDIPAGLAPDIQAEWLQNAKEQANSNYAATGQQQVITMSDDQVDSFTIGDSSRPRRVDAVDISSYQYDLTQANYNEMKKLGVKTVIIKLTEGNYYENPYARNQISMAKAAGLQIAVYHYAKFASASAAAGEANLLISDLRSLGLSKNTLIFADMEDTSTYTTGIQGDLQNFWNTLSNAGFTNHAVYTYVSYEYRDAVVNTVGLSRTWIAQYPYTPSASSLWNSQYAAWQFSSTARLPGYSGNLDVSIDYNGLLNLNSGAWQLKNNQWSYIKSDGSKATGWLADSNNWYYLNTNGVMQTGWVKVQNVWYDLNGSGAMRTGWTKSNNNWYYLSKSGAMQTGWIQVASNWYHMNTNGAMQIGWIQLKNTWYYLENSGKMATNWIFTGNSWYYLRTSGAMVANVWMKDGNQWYHLTNSGKMSTGWLYYKGYWYALNGSGQMQTGWYQTKYGWYYLSNWGGMQTNTWIQNGGHWYHLADSGNMNTGWLYYKGYWYALNGSGQMRTGWYQTKYGWYYLNSWGGMQTNCWLQINGHRYYLNSTGKMLTGWQTINGQRYYFDQNGALQN